MLLFVTYAQSERRQTPTLDLLLSSTINKQPTLLLFQPPPPSTPTGPAASPLLPTATTATSRPQPSRHTWMTTPTTCQSQVSEPALETTWQICHVVQMVMTRRHHRVRSGKYVLPSSILFSHTQDIGATSPTGRCGSDPMTNQPPHTSMAHDRPHPTCVRQPQPTEISPPATNDVHRPRMNPTHKQRRGAHKQQHSPKDGNRNHKRQHAR